MLALLTLRSALHSQITPRGYTGHEMLDAHGIIHMNGRIYDPRLGRFLQADPIVQFPNYSQSWNTYSYVLNNPLTYIDPTGYFPVFTAIAIVGLIAANITTTIVIAAVIGTAVLADSLAQGVPLDKAFLAGVSAAALTYASVGTFPKLTQGGFGLNLATARHVATVAVVGGITSSLQGGKFGHGFLSAGVGAAVGGIPGLRGPEVSKIAARTVVSAVTAGTVSEVTGGKFANGAMTAAFFSLVSSAAQRAASVRQGVHKTTVSRGWDEKQGQSEFDRFTNEFVRRQGVEREWYEDIKVEIVAENIDVLPASVRNFEPGDAIGNIVDDQGLHFWNQRLIGGYHLTVDKLGGPVYLHFDAFDPLVGVGSTIGHGVLEVAPLMMGITRELQPVNLYPDWGR